MKKTTALILLCGASLALSGCINREQADTLLAEACAAGVQAFLPEREKVASIEQIHAAQEAAGGISFRDLKVTLKIDDGFLQNNREYDCVFTEQFGPFSMTYTAAIYKLDMDGKVIGQEGLSIVGTVEDIAKLNAAVAGVLNK